MKYKLGEEVDFNFDKYSYENNVHLVYEGIVKLHGTITRVIEQHKSYVIDANGISYIVHENDIMVPLGQPLTREYFEQHGYEIKYTEVKIGNFTSQVWSAHLDKRFEDGDGLFAKVKVSNTMYPKEFTFSGEICNKVNVNWITLKTVEDLMIIYKLANIDYDAANNKFIIVKN